MCRVFTHVYDVITLLSCHQPFAALLIVVSSIDTYSLFGGTLERAIILDNII